MPSTPQNRRLFLSTLLAATPFAAIPITARAQGNLLDQGRGLLNQIPATSPRPETQAPSVPGPTAGASLSQGEIGSGLKDALKIASQRVVGRVGRPDGYNADPAIRIPLPGPLDKLRGPLKLAGASGLLDDLQLRMNHAAEQAAPKALDILTDAISRLSITDARAILTGPRDAATQYFRRTTSTPLGTAFHPVVANALSSAGAVTAFHAVQTRAATIPLAGQQIQSFDLTDFTVGKALDGLFHYLATEEAAIRTNPAARTTDILKKVFG